MPRLHIMVRVSEWISVVTVKGNSLLFYEKGCPRATDIIVQYISLLTDFNHPGLVFGRAAHLGDWLWLFSDTVSPAEID